MKVTRIRRLIALASVLFSPFFFSSFLLATTPEHGSEYVHLRRTSVLSPDYDFSKEDEGDSGSAFIFNTPNFTTPWYLWGTHNRDEDQGPRLLWQFMKTLEGWDQCDPTLPARERLQDSFDGDLTPTAEARKHIKKLFKQTHKALLAQKMVPTSPQDLRIDLIKLTFVNIELLSFEHIMPSTADLRISPPRLALCHPPASSREVVRYLMDLKHAPEELAIVGVSFTPEEARHLIGWAREMRLSTLALLGMKGSVQKVFAKGLHYHFCDSFGNVRHPYPLHHLVLGADAPLKPIIKRADGTIASRPRYFPTHQVISQDWHHLRIDAPSLITRTSPIPNPARVSEVLRLLRLIAK